MKIDFKKVIENKNEEEFYKNTLDLVIEHLKTRPGTTFWKIVREVRGSDRRVLRLLNEMLKEKIIFLKDKKIYLSNYFGKPLMNPSQISKKMAIMKDMFKEKPFPTFLFDQRPVTLETTIKRAIYLYYRGDVRNKKIALIGDDDLTSISLALIGEAKEIVVFEIDERLIRYIEFLKNKYKLNIKTVLADLSKGVPTEYLSNFDIFLTDPTPKPKPFERFISIGINLLKKEGVKAGYVSFYPSHQDPSLDFQKIFSKLNLIVTDMIPKFTEYDFIIETYRDEDKNTLKLFDSGENRLSFHENFTRFETTDLTKDIIIDRLNVFSEEWMGKATKNVLCDLKKDPAYRRKDKYVVNLAKKLIEKEGVKNEKK